MSEGGPARSPAIPSSFALPLFIHDGNKLRVGGIMFLAAAALYLASNHLHFTIPRLLPLSSLDQAVPFMPNTVWIYLSEYIYFPLIYVLCRDMVNLNKYFFSFFGLQVVSNLIFWAWPTTYPRESFPLPQDLNTLTYFAFSQLRATDSAANCCPSLHVSSVYLSSFIFLDEQRTRFPFFFLYGTLIAASTLTTKQHYLVDVVAGFGMAVLFYWLFHRIVQYRPLSSIRA
jgi:membrane-associated phospholipid phosphatase